MFRPSEFMKTLKQNMTMSFNARRDHAGTIWEGRFYDKRSDPTEYKRVRIKQGYIAQTLPQKPKSPLQRYRLLRKGREVLA